MRGELEEPPSDSAREPSTSALGPDPVLRGLLLKVISSTSFAGMAVSARAAGEIVPSSLVVHARGLLVALLLAPVLWTCDVRFFVRNPLLHLRCLFGSVALELYYWALSRASVADVVVLVNTAPLFVPLIGIAVLGERPRLAFFALLAVGFSGVVILVGPHLGGEGLPLLAAAVSGFLVACGIVCLKKVTEREHPLTIVFVFSIWNMLVPLSAAGGWHFPPALLLAALPYLLLTAVFALGGQWFMTRALSFAPAVLVVLLNYYGVLLTALFAWAIWGQRLSTSFLAGSILIVLSCLATARWRAKLVRTSARPPAIVP